MRLIDADDIHYCEYDLDNYRSFSAVTDDEIAEMPTIDAAPVRHGRWIMEQDYKDGTADFKCSNCEYDDNFFTKTLEIYIKYCPHCGAKMDL